MRRDPDGQLHARSVPQQAQYGPRDFLFTVDASAGYRTGRRVPRRWPQFGVIDPPSQESDFGDALVLSSDSPDVSNGRCRGVFERR
jgi:hypothetical protein